ncbi:MAG: hypothetical protein NVSMB46_02790 [Candidatus Saccharimonadales bacterium]
MKIYDMKLKQDNGFVMPVILILIAIMGIIAYAVVEQASNNLTIVYKQAYIEMSRLASKAAIDYAQEQFDTALCGNYNGTAEQNLVSNSRYRVTYKVDVSSTSTDGFSKNIIGTGSVYLPLQSSTAKYVFDVHSNIIRTYATCKTPYNFGPTVWLDASNVATLKKIGVSTSTVSPNTNYGNTSDTTRDTLKERADNGSQNLASWQSPNFDLHTCNSAEFSVSICTNVATQYLNDGIIYSNVTVPKNATISSATIVLSCATPSGQAGTLVHRIYGIYKSATNLHPDLFTQSGTAQLLTPLTTAGLHTTAYKDVTENNCPPGNNTVYDVTNIVQEIVNNANWDPTTGGARIGFAIEQVSGAGTRNLLKNNNLFNVSYATTTLSQANNADSIGEWDDISGNGNNAKFYYGTAPIRVDNQINSKTVVRFNNGDMASTLTRALVNKREMTILAVVKPNFTTSALDGRFITGMTTSNSNDTVPGTSIIPFFRYSNNSGFSSNYSSTTSSYRTDYNCGSACASNPYIFASTFAVDTGTNLIDSYLRGDGAQVASNTNINPPSATPPYTYSIDQFYYGGDRNGALSGGVGQDYLNGDYAELIIYDHALQCHDIESLEDYLRSKWGIASTPYTDTCPAPAIPTL